MKNDLAAALGVIAFAASFWIQRGSSGLSGVFIDPVILLVFGFGALLLIKTIAQRLMRTESEPASSAQKIRIVQSLAAFVIVVLWILGITRLGFMLSSFLGISSLSFLLQTEKITVRSALLTTTIAALLTVFVYVVFHEFLYVPLPSGPLLDAW